MTLLLAIFLGLLGMVALLGVVGFILSRSVVRGNADRAALVLGPPGPDDLQQSAALLQPESERGIGILRLTTDDLLFAAGDGERLLQIARADIAQAGSSSDLDGLARPLKRPALVVRTNSGGLTAFAVSDVTEWTRRLTPG